MSVIQTNQAVSFNPAQLIKSAQEIKQSLSQIAPDESKTTKIITFALVATAMVGMFVYHYMKSQEEPPSSPGVFQNSVKEVS
jgi:hypothetical protein